MYDSVVRVMRVTDLAPAPVMPPTLETVVVGAGINDPQYAEEVLARFDAMTKDNP